MTGENLLDLLALRLEDASKTNFPDSYKVDALNSAQLRVANMLANPYLTELEVLESGLTVTSGKTAVLSSTNLTSNYSLLRGGQGILSVCDASSGLYLTRVDLADLKKNENSYLAGTVRNPLYFVFENKICTLPASGISSVNVWYLRQPLPIFCSYTASGGDTGTSLTSDESILGTTADYYNGGIIWNRTTANYFAIKDYLWSDTTGTFTVDDPGAGTAGTADDEFYLLTHDFETKNLANAACELSADLHSIVLDLAEADCWAVDDDNGRRTAALENAYGQIKALNERVEIPEGIGTRGDKRYAATA